MRLFEVERKVLLVGLVILLLACTGVAFGEINEDTALQFNEGMNLYHRGEYNQALQKFETSLRLNKELDNKSGILASLTYIGLIYRAKGELDKTLGYFEEALKLAREIPYKEGIAVSLSNIAEIYRTKGEFDKALEYCEQALKLDREMQNKAGIAADLDYIGRIYSAKGELDKALEYYEEALELDTNRKSKVGILASLTNIVSIYIAKGEFDKALKYNKEALKLVQEIENKENITKSELDEILEKYKQTLKLVQKRFNREDIAIYLNNIGEIYRAKGEFDNAIEKHRQALKLAREIENKEGIAASLNNIGKIYREKGELDRAFKYCEEALKLAREMRNKKYISTCLNNIGLIYNAKGELDKALEYFEEALKLAREIPYKKGIAASLNNISLIYKAKGELDIALDNYNDALSLFREMDYKEGVVMCLNNIGIIYDTKGELDKALEYYEEALRLAKEMENKEGIAVCLNSIGLIYESKGELDRALGYCEEALKLAREIPDKEGIANCLNSIGGISLVKGDLDKALEYFEEVLKLAKEMEHKVVIVVSLNAIGEIYREKGEHDKALENYKQALKLAQEIPYKKGIAAYLNNIGTIYHAKGELDKALEYYEEALRLGKEMENKVLITACLNNIGEIYREKGEHDKALENYKQALKLAQEVPYKKGIATSFNNIGLIYNAKGELDKALGYYQQALVSVSTGLVLTKDDPFPNPELDKILYPDGAYVTLANKSYLFEEKARNVKKKDSIRFLTQAYQSFKLSIKILEGMRAKFKAEETKMGFIKERVGIYEGIIGILLKMHSLESDRGYDQQAFWYAEKGKARALVEMLEEAKVEFKEGVEPELLKKEKGIVQSLSFIQTQIEEGLEKKGTDSPEIKILLRQKLKLEERLQALEREIKKKSPKYASIRYPEPITVKDIQERLLDKDTVVLEYSLGVEGSFLWVIGKGFFKVYSLPKYEDIVYKGVEFFSTLLDPTSDSIKKHFQLGWELYHDLILPAERDGLLKGKRLVIVPEDILYYLPFEALISKKIKENGILTRDSYKDISYLFKGYSISYTQSVSVLDVLRKERQAKKEIKDRKELLAVGISRFKDPESTPLYYSRIEVERITGLYKKGATIYLDEEATEARIKEEVLDRYKRIHISTHGHLRKESEYSGLVFYSGGNKEEDGFLRTVEIFNLKLNADLVVLSACQTGLGEMVRGEGIVGLTRAFMYAGTSSIIVSLWNVADKSTAMLMERFYSNLEQGLPKDEALKRAKLELMNCWDIDEYGQVRYFNHPFYWAPFVLMGRQK